MFTSLPDSPQSVGDIVGIACRLVRGNIKLIWNFLLIPTIFVTVAGVVFQWVFTYGVSNVAQTRDVATAFGLAAVWFVGFAVFAVAWWILSLRLLAIVRLALGFATNLEEAKQYMYRRKWAVLGVYMLTFVLLLAATMTWAFVMAAGAFLSSGPTVAAALAFTVGGAGMICTFGIYALASHLALCILACEDVPMTTVVGRALSLVFKHFWRASAFGLLFTVTFTVISYPMSLPVAILSLGDALQHGLSSGGSSGLAGYKPPLYILVIAQTWENLMGMYLRPLVVLAFGLFYYDLRLRSEGLDIKRKLELIVPEAA